MAPTSDYDWDEAHEMSPKKTYTFNEAIEYMKERDKYPTKRPISWVNVKTGKPVIIGYNH